MTKQDFGNVTGKCTVCTINLWDASGGEPAVWPCNVPRCPYEKGEDQHTHLSIPHGGEMSSGLGQIDM